MTTRKYESVDGTEWPSSIGVLPGPKSITLTASVGYGNVSVFLAPENARVLAWILIRAADSIDPRCDACKEGDHAHTLRGESPSGERMHDDLCDCHEEMEP